MICDPLSNPKDPLCNIRMTENLDSRTRRKNQQGETWELHFTVQGTNDQCLVDQRVTHPSIGVPSSFGKIPRDNYSIRNIGWELWDVQVTYAWTGSRESVTGQPVNQSYSTRGGRLHLTQSLEHLTRYPATAPDLDGAINFDGERVKGVDVIAPNLVYNEAYMFTRQQIFDGGKDSLFQRWSDLTATVHGATEVQNPPPPITQTSDFRYWSPGEVLLNGVTMRQTSANQFEVTFEFFISPTKRFKLPKSIDAQEPEIVVEGWDLIWFQYAKTDEDTGNGKVVKGVPKAMYTERIYKRSDFAQLGIGTGPPPASGITDPECENPDFETDWNTYCTSP